jgi:Flp pilus assembly protein CpaB
MSTKGLVILAVVLGALGMILVHGAAKPVETVKVVVVTQDLAAGTKLGKDFAREVEIPRALAKRYCRFEEDARLWQGATLARPVGEGELLTPGHLRASSRARLADQLGSEERAVSISLARGLSVGPFLSPGNRVDILATSRAEGDKPSRTQLLLDDVEILAVGAWAERSFLDPVTVRATGPATLTLRLEADDAKRLAHAVATGVVLHVTLRAQAGATKDSSADVTGGDIAPAAGD